MGSIALDRVAAGMYSMPLSPPTEADYIGIALIGPDPNTNIALGLCDVHVFYGKKSATSFVEKDISIIHLE